MKEKLAILISGGGTTASEIIKATISGRLNLDIACLISNNSDAAGLDKAKNLGIPLKDILVIPQKPKENFGRRLLEELENRNVTLVGQHGWLPLTPEEVINKYPERIFNQHPGNPHLFGGKSMWGLTVHQAAIEFNRATNLEPNTWMIVQRVSPKFDEGHVLSAVPVKISQNDTATTLQQRSLPIEHQGVVSFYQNLLSNNLSKVRLTQISDLTKSEIEILNQCRQHAISMNLNS
ncbi:MAG: formyltransferase family protein [Candidatus Shapirobacteria bacterium]|nr:formyltransferase family protein [Candidatus Shapirobacteria bacterium]